MDIMEEAAIVGPVSKTVFTNCFVFPSIACVAIAISRYKIQDTNQFIGNHVGWIVIYIIHNTIQAS